MKGAPLGRPALAAIKFPGAVSDGDYGGQSPTSLLVTPMLYYFPTPLTGGNYTTVTETVTYAHYCNEAI